MGDLNNDNWIDIAVTHWGTHQIGILVNQDDQTFIYKTIDFTDDASPYVIDIDYFNEDQHLDLVVTSKDTSNTVI